MESGTIFNKNTAVKFRDKKKYPNIMCKACVIERDPNAQCFAKGDSGSAVVEKKDENAYSLIGILIGHSADRTRTYFSPAYYEMYTYNYEEI